MTDTSITLPREEFAAYQRAVESAKNEVARLVQERDEARQREKIASAAYHQQQAELDAAREIIRAARIAAERSLFPGRGALQAQLYAYDAIVKKVER